MESKNIFHKTTTAIDKINALSIFDKRMLEKGIEINMLDSEYRGFFKLRIDGAVYFACAYLYIIDESLFAKQGAPKVHFLQCEDIKNANSSHVKVCIPKANSFDYRVRSNGVDTRLFYEHPLHICPLCIHIFCKILSKKHNREITSEQLSEDKIMKMLISNKLKNFLA